MTFPATPKKGHKTIMPLFQLKTSAAVPEEKRLALLKAISRLIAERIGKPETYVMGTLTTESMIMSGTAEPAAFVDVRSIGGLSDAVNRQISQDIATLAQAHLGVPADRLFLNFTDVPANHWGWRGSTIG
jgi:phenylpyruvate tautomerase